MVPVFIDYFFYIFQGRYKKRIMQMILMFCRKQQFIPMRKKENRLPHGEGAGVRTMFPQSDGHESVARRQVSQTEATLAGLFVVLVNATLHERHQLRPNTREEEK